MKSIIIKDLKLFFKDKRGLVLFLLLPVFLIALFAFAYGNMGGKLDPIPIVVLDEDQSKESSFLIHELDTVEYVYVVDTDAKQAQKLLNTGKVSVGIIIKKGFLDSIAQDKSAFEFVYDPSETFKIGIVKQAVLPKLYKLATLSKMTQNLTGNANRIDGNILDKLSDQVDSIEEDQGDLIEYKAINEVQKSDNIGLIQAISGTLVLMLLFGVRTIGVQILNEKRDKTFLRTMVSPLSPTKYMTAKLIFAMIIAFIQMSVMLIFAYFAFGFDMFYDIGSLILLCFMTALACSSFSLLLGSFVKSNEELQSISTILILAMSAIGGSMVPHFIMPAFMQKISVFSINYWTIQGFFDIYSRQLGLQGILQNLLILGLISAVFLALSWYLFVYKFHTHKAR